ncbi:MAG: hypothetical protein ACUZ8N_12550 [Candidatus Scalindua sp.]
MFCVDPVAVDSYGATMFDYHGRDIGYIRESYVARGRPYGGSTQIRLSREAGLGEIDFKLRGFEEITI